MVNDNKSAEVDDFIKKPQFSSKSSQDLKS